MTKQAPGDPLPQLVDQVIDTACRNRRNDLVTRLRDARHLLAVPAVTVPVVGQARQGRSTLINALRANKFGDITFSDGAETAMAPALIFVTDAFRELTETELEFLRSTGDRYPEILFVLTKTDASEHWQHMLETDLAKLAKAGITVTPFAVSAALASAAIRRHDFELADRSGLLPLVARLTELTTSGALAFHLRAALDELESGLTERAGALEEAGLASTRDELATALRRSRRLREKSARWQQLLNDGFAAITSDIEFDLKIRTRSVLADAEKAIEAGDPARNWAAFEEWLRGRLADETVQNYAQLVESVRQLARKVNRLLGDGPLPDLRAVADASPDDVANAIETDDGFTRRGGVVRAGLSVFQRGYGGFMMFMVLTHYVAAIAVPMPFGVAAALVMGGAGFTDERKRQLEKRRGQAKSTVKNYIDQFNLRVGKQARATLRRLQLQLRDEYAGRMLAAQRAADDAVQEAETTLDDAEPAQRELDEVTRELRALPALRAACPPIPTR
jgi:hypothetical protein